MFNRSKNKTFFVLLSLAVISIGFLPVFGQPGSATIQNHKVDYNIENGQVVNLNLEPHFFELILDFVTSGDGFVEVTIPRTLLDAKLSETQDDIFFVIVDGFETEYIEIASDSKSRTIVIPFFDGDEQLEIIGTSALTAPVTEIPDWVRNNAEWWSEDKIADADFVSGIQYLISKGIMTIPDTQSGQPTGEGIPDWVKNNAGWWAEGKIGDSDFVSGIQYLITKGIIAV